MKDVVQGAPSAHKSSPSRAVKLRRTLLLVSAMAVALTMAAVEAPTIAAKGPAAGSTAAKGSDAARIVKLAKQAVGHGFRMGTEGPQYFDCSGLIYSVFKRAGLVSRVGGARRGATGYLHWAQSHGLVTRGNPHVGDVIIWGKHGKVAHSGIYIGGGRVISALNRKLGVRNWPMSWIHMRIFGIIHVRISH